MIPEVLEARKLLSAQLLKDINSQPGESISDANSYFALNGAVVFFATDGGGRAGLWRTDGTAQGTQFLKTIADSFGGIGTTYHNRNMLVVGKTLYFEADDGVHGTELWKTDGTRVGTMLVKDINPGPAGSGADYFAVLGSTLFFTADDGTHGAELWKSDGSPAGTVLVKDIVLGPLSSVPLALAPAGGKMLFSATGPGLKGNQLWATDGSAAGTAVVKVGPSNPGNFNIGPGERVDQFAPIGDKLYFAAGSAVGRVLWVSDGTAGGTHEIAIPSANYFGSNPNNFLAASGLLYFEGLEASGTTIGLYRLDTAAASATPVDVSSLGPNGFAPLTTFHGSVYLLAAASASSPAGLFKVDPSSSDLERLNTLPAGQAGSFAASADTLYFEWSSSRSGVQLYRSDGTAGGTSLVYNGQTVYNSPPPTSLVALGTSVYFTGDDGVHYAQPWVSDGTAAGTRMIADLFPPNTAGSKPSAVEDLNGVGVFAATDGIHGFELWATGGTAATTRLVKDINPGAADGLTTDAVYPGVGDHRGLGPVYNGVVYFAADDGVHGNSLWRSDGSADATYLLKQIEPDLVDGNYPQTSVVFGGKLYFTASDQAGGTAVWSTDGTADGTTLLSPAPPASSKTAWLTVVGDTLYFVASGTQLWKSDGTPAGTTLVKDFAGSTLGPEWLTDYNGQLYFSDSPSGPTAQLWRSDGTSAGTQPVPGVALSGLYNLTSADGLLFFGTSAGNVPQLWSTDGTAVNTHPIPGVSFADYPVWTFGVADDVIYLLLENGVRRPAQLWRTDGTPANTFTLHAFPVSDREPAEIIGAAAGRFFLNVFENGRYEIWQSDGTVDGTYAVGAVPSADTNGWFNAIGEAGGLVYAGGYSNAYGFAGSEPYIINLQQGTIAGSAFIDDNYDGVRDASEVPLAGVTIYIDSNGNGHLDTGEPTATTDIDGHYRFDGLTAGNYTVRQVEPAGAGFRATNSAVNVTLRPGELSPPAVFGDVQIATVTLSFPYLLTLAQHYGRPGTFATGDLDDDGQVGFSDLLTLAQHYEQPLGSPGTSTTAVQASELLSSSQHRSQARAGAVRRMH